MYCNGINRKINRIHAQIRMECSDLNKHLLKLHVIDSSICEMCTLNQVESANHYFFDCPMFRVERCELFRKINSIINCNVSLDVILFGCDNLSDEKNTQILESVEKFIKDSGRFRL